MKRGQERGGKSGDRAWGTDDPGGEAPLERAKTARRYLEKVAEGKFLIPGYSDAESASAAALETGNIRVSSRPKLDLRGF